MVWKFRKINKAQTRKYITDVRRVVATLEIECNLKKKKKQGERERKKKI